MVRYAVISNNIVVNVIMAESGEAVSKLTGLTGVASETASIGDTYDAESDQFIVPVATETPEAIPFDNPAK